jgi:hypothetical protein
VFGAPYNGTDAVTDRVLAEDPDIKVFLYGRRGNRACGKLILDRVGAVNIEYPIFHPNPGALAAAYEKHAPQRAFFVLQGHPGPWDDARWRDFVKLIDWLQENQIPIVTASDLLATAAPENGDDIK